MDGIRREGNDAGLCEECPALGLLYLDVPDEFRGRLHLVGGFVQLSVSCRVPTHLASALYPALYDRWRGEVWHLDDAGDVLAGASCGKWQREYHLLDWSFWIFYLLSSYRKGRLSCWMFTGFVGLAIGYLLLMLSPGNLIRAEQSKDTFDLFQANAKALVLFWANTLVLSYFYFYLLKGWRKRKLLAVVPQAKKYMHLSGWFILQSFLFEGIMYFSPEFPLRSIFPCTIFCIVSTFIMHRLAQQAGVRLTPVSVARNMKRIAVVYFCLTFMMSCWLYIQNALWFQRWEAQALALQGTSAVLEVTERPPYEGKKWSMLTGVHAYEYGLMEQQEDWKMWHSHVFITLVA